MEKDCPNLHSPMSDTLDPSREKERIDNEEDNVAQSNMEMQLPNRP
jgi:hypothetical protein